jgi:uncharacterized membrane protein YkvA (DUF1232 family)
MIWRVIIGVACAFALAWLVFVLVLARSRPQGGLLVESLRLIPDTVRLLRGLATDKSLPRGVRVRLWLLLAYLASPIDLIPDFIPVLGYADDAIIVCAVLRAIVRRAGPEVIRRHWPGTEDGMAALWRAAGLPPEIRVQRNGQ